MLNYQTLETVELAFQEWRATRPHKATKTPHSLRQQAVALIPHYPMSLILKKLDINSGALKYWLHEHTPVPSSNEFVSLPDAPGTHAIQEHHSLQLEIKTTQGIQVTLSGHLSPEWLGSFVREMQA